MSFDFDTLYAKVLASPDYRMNQFDSKHEILDHIEEYLCDPDLNESLVQDPDHVSGLGLTYDELLWLANHKSFAS